MPSIARLDYNAGGVNWVARLGAPGVLGGPIQTNGTKITIVAQTAANRDTIKDSTSPNQPPSVVVNWPHLAFAPTPAPTPNLILSGPVGSGLGVQPALRGTLWIRNTGLADTGQVNANLAADMVAPGNFLIPQENIKITPKEFNLAPNKEQQIKFEVSIPVNTSFGGPLVVPGPIPPLPNLTYQSAVVVQGSCVNPLTVVGPGETSSPPTLKVTVEPYRDDDLIRLGFTGFCEDCADAWQAFSFPVVGVDNPIALTTLGSTLHNQLEDDFGLVNQGTTPFQAVRWDPARRTNLSFRRYTPLPKEFLEPNPHSSGFPPNILPGQAFSMVRRTRGDITMDGYFVDHAPNLPEANYPLARFPNLNGGDYRGSWDLTFPPPTTPLPASPAPFTDAVHLLVGNPFAFPIRIYQQSVFNGTGVIDQMNGLEAGDMVRDVRHYNRWVGQLFLQIQNSLNLPATFSPWNGTLQPTQGCWVTFGAQANLNFGIRFNSPPVVSDQTPWPQMIDFTFSKKKNKGGVELPEDLREIEDKAVVSGWGYRITAINTEGLSRTLIVGAYPGASNGYDSSDVDSMFSNDTRPEGMDFDFVIDHPGWGATGLFLREMVDPDDVRSGVAIPLQVLSSVKDDVTLVCEAIGTPPRRLAATISEAGGSPLVDLTSPTGSLSVPNGSSDYVLTLKTWATSDVNQDDSINSLDLFGFSKEYEKTEPKNPADLNNNNQVEAKDLIELLKVMK